MAAAAPETKAGPLLDGTDVPSGSSSPASRNAFALDDASHTSWVFWYPTWDAWKFQRTLTYWISVLYLEGSILFSVGAAFSMCGDLMEKRDTFEKSLVTTPYFVGGICFTLGSYLGVLEVVNTPYKLDRIKAWCVPIRRSQWRFLRDFVHWRAVAGYSAYTLGALCFNVNTVASYMTLDEWQVDAFVWLAGTLGALGFTIGSVLECYTNKIWLLKLRTCEWWLSVCNFVGSIGFLISGVSGLSHSENAKWTEDFPYLVGSLAFMLGALFTLWLWKCEQYGLGFMPEINIRRPAVEPNSEAVLSMQEEYGCGRASAWQLPFLTMYLTSATASVLLVGLAIFTGSTISTQDYNYDVFEAILNFALSHGVMLLGSVVHHIPTARPHSWLLIYMRVVLGLYFVNNWLSVQRHIVTAISA